MPALDSEAPDLRITCLGATFGEPTALAHEIREADPLGRALELTEDELAFCARKSGWPMR